MRNLADLEAKRRALMEQLADMDKEIYEAAKEAEDYVSANEARNILAQLSEVNEPLPFPRFLPVVQTLVNLRPDPDLEEGSFYTWMAGGGGDWSVDVYKSDAKIYLYGHGEDMSFNLTQEEAELVGSWLLGAADTARKIEEKEKE